MDEYKKDTEGVNVVACVHVEAVFPGNPVEETMYVLICLCVDVSINPDCYGELK